MDPQLLLRILWFPLLVLVVLAGYVYVDAPSQGMDPRKWAAITLLVPVFGLFAYLLERSERTPDPDREMVRDGLFEIHESRAEETRLDPGGPPDGDGQEDDVDGEGAGADDDGRPDRD